MSANTTQRSGPPASDSTPGGSNPAQQQQSSSSPPASPNPQQPIQTASSPPPAQPTSPNQPTTPNSPPPAAGTSQTRPKEASTPAASPTASSVPPVIPPTSSSTASSPPPPIPTSSSTNSLPPPANSSLTASSVPLVTTTSSTPSSSSQSNLVSSSTITIVNGDSTSIRVITATSTTQLPAGAVPSSGNPATTSAATPIDASGGSSSGLSQPAKVAIGVVSIAAIALLAVIGLFWWKKRRARQQAEEERRKEVEDYAYNPNDDPTIPSVAGHSPDANYDMREDAGHSGYRGWGPSTAPGAGSVGRKTTMSAGMAAVGLSAAHSDGHSPTRANGSEARSAEPLLNGSPTSSPKSEPLGNMGPPAAHNRVGAGGDVHRGPSNASYSAAARSDASDSGLYNNSNTNTNAYYDQYVQNPYTDQAAPAKHPGQAVIRDNPAHYPQQSAGIAQNF